MRPILVIAAAASLAGCAGRDGAGSQAAAPGEVRQCFWPSQVSGFTEAGRDRIHVHVGPGDVYLFETMGHCPDLDFSERLGFDTRGSTTVCSGLDVTLVVPSSIGPRRCPVRMIRKLGDEEVRAERRGQSR